MSLLIMKMSFVVITESVHNKFVYMVCVFFIVDRNLEIYTNLLLHLEEVFCGRICLIRLCRHHYITTVVLILAGVILLRR